MHHAMGGLHEQQRNRRKYFVKINWENIESNYNDQYALSQNTRNSEVYDYQSILQYHLTAFSSNSKATMVIPDQDLEYLISNSKYTFSFYDIAEVNQVYSCPSATCSLSCQNHGFRKQAVDQATCSCHCPTGLKGTTCEQLDTDSGCGSIINLSNGGSDEIKVTSYTSGKLCTWLVKAEANSIIKATVTSVDLPFSSQNECQHWLEFRDYLIGDPGKELCGKSTTAKTYTQANIGESSPFMIRFNSKNDVTSGTGFTIRVEAMQSGCMSSPCKTGSLCTEGSGDGSYTCTCQNGLSGTNCDEFRAPANNECDLEEDFGTCIFDQDTSSDSDFRWSFNTRLCDWRGCGNGVLTRGTSYQYLTLTPYYDSVSWGYGSKAIIKTAAKFTAVDRCLSFDYAIGNYNEGSYLTQLNVYVEGTGKSKTNVKNIQTTTNYEWISESVSIEAVENLVISIEGIIGPQLIGVDSIALRPGLCTNTPCNPNPCQNGGSCDESNPPAGSKYVCTCPTGFSGDRCETSTDFCANSPCKNGGTCTSGSTTYSCQCPTGFTGNTCDTSTDFCANSPCKNGGTCTSGSSTYSCQCPTGFTGNTCETSIDFCANSPCKNGATCTSGSSTYSCQCSSGFTGNTCETSTDFCANSPCKNGGTCTSGSTTYSCQCPTGFTGNTCETSIDFCANSPCKNGATCTSGSTTYSCQCPLGFTGNTCETSTDFCANSPCKNGGTCTSGSTTYSCQCPTGFTGNTCETLTDFCANSPCKNGATCTSGSTTYICQCPTGFTGNTCETSTDFCTNSPCKNGGTCTSGSSTYSCQCPTGFTGNTCETSIDFCANSPCKNGGTCTSGSSTYSCQCPTGFTGNTCETSTNFCANSPCKNGGTCTSGSFTYSCQCPTGFTGNTCETSTDFCSNSPCKNGGTCTSGSTTYSCQCSTGFTGNTCEDTIDNGNATSCADNPCQNGGTCVETPSGSLSYSCTCPSGFPGLNCEGRSCRFELENDPACFLDTHDSSSYWFRRQGPTPSSGTGPSSAYEGEFYFYFEATRRRRWGSYYFFDNGVFFEDTTHCLSLYYLMRGRHIGSFSIYTYKYENGYQEEFSVRGSQGNQWHKLELNIHLDPDTFIVMEAVRGRTFRSDIAIDDVILMPYPCPTGN
ncbi:fibropellin-1-like [Saccostrea echinata]|uniref:fibropellin-1-like n=1 Tax=Saccostrea echinata TaxID=191078 RepID=UPI002A80EB4A|nr:fibropellin-1-like [Saccostrea echinata]